MAAIKWTDVGVGDTSGYINSIIRAGEGVGASFDSFGNRIKEYTESREEDESAALISKLRATDNSAVRDSLIAEASKKSDYLDLDRISEINYDLGADERALETQLAAEERAIKAATEAEARNVANLKQVALFKDDLEDKNVLLQNSFLTATSERDAEIAADVAQELADEKSALEVRLKEEQAAKEIALAEIQAKLELDILNIENAEKEAEAKREAEKLRIELEGKKKTGLDAIVYKITGGADIDHDLGTGDAQAYNAMQVKLEKYGITKKVFDDWAALHVTFKDDAISPNSFRFDDKGVMTSFGKGWGAMSDDVVQRVAAAIRFDKQDEKTKAIAWQLFQSSSMDDKKGEGQVNEVVPVQYRTSYSAFEKVYDRYSMTSLRDRQQSVTDFFESLKTAQNRDYEDTDESAIFMMR